MVGLNFEINLSMQVVGHTRCLVDGNFGQAKKLYRKYVYISQEPRTVLLILLKALQCNQGFH